MRNQSLNEQAAANLDEPWKDWLKEMGYPPLSLHHVDQEEVSWVYRRDMDRSLIPQEYNNPDYMLESVLAGKTNWSVGATIVQLNPLTLEERQYWLDALMWGAMQAAAPLKRSQDDERPKGALKRDY